MSEASGLLDIAADMRQWRRDIHKHPELGFEEHRTAKKVAALLESWGLDVATGVGGTTCVVGTLRGKRGKGLSIGLRADMDALPMRENGHTDYRSVHDNVFHGCGHDGHTSILLGTAKYLSTRTDFKGTDRKSTSELQSLRRISNAVFCLNKKKHDHQ